MQASLKKGRKKAPNKSTRRLKKINLGYFNYCVKNFINKFFSRELQTKI
jgi:hypothetical protein